MSGVDGDHIKVWPFDDAPCELRDLSPHGGDEDWLAHVPVIYAERYIPWLDGEGPFGRCEITEHRMPDGSVVFIGAHA